MMDTPPILWFNRVLGVVIMATPFLLKHNIKLSPKISSGTERKMWNREKSPETRRFRGIHLLIIKGFFHFIHIIK